MRNYDYDEVGVILRLPLYYIVDMCTMNTHVINDIWRLWTHASLQTQIRTHMHMSIGRQTYTREHVPKYTYVL